MEEVRPDELAGSLAASLNTDENDARALVNAVIDFVGTSLNLGSGLQVPGLGVFVAAVGDVRKGTVHISQEIRKDLAKRVGRPEEKTGEIIDAFARMIREELAQGKKVILGGLGALEVSAERPKVLEDVLGNKTLKPLPPSVVFATDPSFAALITPKKASFIASEEVRREILSAKSPTIQVVAPEFDFFVGVIEYHFQKAGWQVEKSKSIVDAIMRIDAGKTYAIVLDATLKEQQKLCRAMKSRRETNKIPIVMMCPEHDIFSDTGLFIQPDVRLNQPFDIKQLIKVVEREIIRAFNSDQKFQQRIVCTIPSDSSRIEGVIELTQKLFEGSGLFEEGQIALSAAFREAIGNAIRHGNCHDLKKKVEIECVLDEQNIRLAIRDEGRGFEHTKFARSDRAADAVAAAREVYANGKRGGLGILLMLKCCDKVEYNQKGNVVILTKAIKSSGE